MEEQKILDVADSIIWSGTQKSADDVLYARVGRGSFVVAMGGVSCATNLVLFVCTYSHVLRTSCRTED
jgi:hypothetical protein